MVLHKILAAALIAGWAAFMPARALADDQLELVASGQDGIFLNLTNPRYGYHDFVVHNIGVRNSGDTVVTLESLRLDVMRDEIVLLSRHLSANDVVQDTAQLAGNPLPVFTAFQLLSDDGVSGFFGASTVLAGSITLQPGEGVVTSGHHISIDDKADAVRLYATATGEGAGTLQASLTIPLEAPENHIAYRLPLKGNWFMRALPVIESHHRLNAATEYAVDFFKLDGAGRAVVGDRIDANNYPGFGQPVYAAAAGTVVHVEAEAVQDRAAFAPREGETPQARGRRLQQMMMQGFQENSRRAAGGNLITIRHEVDGHVEYSSYAHLKAGSVMVQVGDMVHAGQQIAEVGDTGDSPAVHLHFQVNSGPDAFTSASLPFRFSGLQHAVRPPEPGLMVRSVE